MKNIEDLFRESSNQYLYLENEATSLGKKMICLSPDEILSRCECLGKLHREQIKVDSFIMGIITDCGPEILREPFIYEYKEALDSALEALDVISLQAGKLLQTLNSSKPSLPTKHIRA